MTSLIGGLWPSAGASFPKDGSTYCYQTPKFHDRIVEFSMLMSKVALYSRPVRGLGTNAVESSLVVD